MTDLEIARKIHGIALATPRTTLQKQVIAIMPKEGKVISLDKEQATQYFARKHEAIFVEMPKLAKDGGQLLVAQVAIAVGRRLERFERGRKANATRTPNSRQKIAQNAIQSRWSAK